MTHDLRALAAPIEALRAEVDAAYKRLDSYWTSVLNELQKLPIPCDVGCDLPACDDVPGEWMRLELQKSGKRKRLYIVRYWWDALPSGEPTQTYSSSPYEEWSGDQRIWAMEYVPKLFEAAAKQTKEFIERTKL